MYLILIQPKIMHTIYVTVNTIVIVYIPHISISLTTAEAAVSKGDSLNVYMKSVKDKLDKGTMDEVKLQINKLKEVFSDI